MTTFEQYKKRFASWVSTLTLREKAVLITSLALSLIGCFYFLIYAPMVNGQEANRAKIKSKRANIGGLKTTADKIIQLEDSLAKFRQDIQRPGVGQGGALSLVESYLLEAGVDKKLVKISPGQSKEIDRYTQEFILVEVVDISLGGLVKFLKILKEKEPAYRVDRISIKPRFRNKEKLYISIAIATYRI